MYNVGEYSNIGLETTTVNNDLHYVAYFATDEYD